MPHIPLDFSNVETFDSLPVAKYFGSIDKIEYREATDPTKFPQLQVVYLVIDGEFLGRKQSEFLSMSPKAAFRLKKWVDRFGFEEPLAGLDIDEETNQLLDPDLVGVNVIFEVYQDPKLYQGERQMRVRLVEVLDDDGAPIQAEAEATVVVAAAPEAEPEEEETAAPVAAAPAAAPAAAAPRRSFAPRSAAAQPAAAGPARRTLK